MRTECSFDLCATLETESEAIRRLMTLQNRVENLALPREIASYIDNDPEAHMFNPRPVSPVAARAFRVKQLERVEETATVLGIAPTAVLTILLQWVEAGDLHKIDPRAARARVRTILDRAQCQTSIFIGVIEIDWKADIRKWLIHAHGVCFNFDEASNRRLLCSLPAGLPESATKRQVLKDAGCQTPYMLGKFTTYMRLKNKQAVPLPSAALIELLKWWWKWEFADFAIRYGIRRRARMSQ